MLRTIKLMDTVNKIPPDKWLTSKYVDFVTFDTIWTQAAAEFDNFLVRVQKFMMEQNIKLNFTVGKDVVSYDTYFNHKVVYATFLTCLRH